MSIRRPARTVVRGLSKRYGDVIAVDDVSFEVPPGGLFAFLGANGAGKSTTIGALTTVIAADAGSIEVAGHDVRTDGDAVRRAIGVVFQDSLLDHALTVRENLTVRARAYLGSSAEIAERIARLVEVIDLGGFVDRRYGRLSGRQRRRVDIARALPPKSLSRGCCTGLPTCSRSRGPAPPRIWNRTSKPAGSSSATNTSSGSAMPVPLRTTEDIGSSSRCLSTTKTIHPERRSPPIERNDAVLPSEESGLAALA